MIKRTDSIVYQKSFGFAIKIVQLYKWLNEEKKEFILSKQLLRSGTSIGANVREALEGQSRKDFISKMSISLKEAAETEYWLELLKATDYIEEQTFETLIVDVKELMKLLNAIIKTSKNTIRNNQL